jgi:putative hydrolase of the HAD superfamily
MTEAFPASDWDQIQAVTFDVGGTLIEPWPSVGHVYAQAAAEFGVRDLEPDALTRAFASTWQGRAHFSYSQGDWFEIVRQTFGARAGELPDAFFPAVYARFAEPEVWRVFDDVHPVLVTLRLRGLRLGVVSNWDERLVPLLGRLGLDDHFGTLVVSCEAGHTKPAPEIFHAAARRLRLEANQVLHIGDSEREDVQGARAAGWRAMRIDRQCGGDLRKLIAPLLEG